jgi:NAD(P)-dependent dehydrogenase (short-subunit alcohol dehydrogenase family)
MARCLIIGCGCRGRALARELVARGHAVRATTRDPGRVDAVAATGAEPIVGDPDRVGTLAPAFEHVAAACILLGSATGSPDALAALHGTRLEMLLSRMLDSTVRGIVYEVPRAGDPAVRDGGVRRVRAFCEDSLIPYALLDGGGAWPAAGADAVDRVLEGV